MMYYKLPNGNPTSNVRGLIPSVINPSALSDEELLEYQVSRCEVIDSDVKWWQIENGWIYDTTQNPHRLSKQVIDLPLERVKEIAWNKVKDERAIKQSGLMPYTYPSGDTHHNEMTDKVIRDLSASTTAAIVLVSQGVSDAIMPWTTHENVTHMLAPEQMIAFGLTATQWHSTIHLISQQIRPQIEAAQTVAEVISAAQWPGV